MPAPVRFDDRRPQPSTVTTTTVPTLNSDTAQDYAFDKPPVTLTLMSARTDGDDPDGDGPRVADSNRKQRQHTDGHKGEAALRVVE